ncbi:MAG: hypothetical protein KA206_01035 [Paludibacter sp.]|nr:hypothetical protein [Paludibacter sp.]
MNEKLTPELRALLLIVLAKGEISAEQKQRLFDLLGFNSLTIKIVDE